MVKFTTRLQVLAFCLSLGWLNCSSAQSALDDSGLAMSGVIADLGGAKLVLRSQRDVDAKIIESDEFGSHDISDSIKFYYADLSLLPGNQLADAQAIGVTAVVRASEGSQKVSSSFTFRDPDQKLKYFLIDGDLDQATLSGSSSLAISSQSTSGFLSECEQSNSPEKVSAELDSSFLNLTTNLKVREVELSVDVDSKFYQKHGKEVIPVISRIIHDGESYMWSAFRIRLKLNEIHIWKSAKTDPYTDFSGLSVEMVRAFRDLQVDSNYLQPADLYHLFSGASSGAGGYGYIAGLCGSWAYSVSRPRPAPPGGVFAHEMGHVIGAGHDSENKIANIMSLRGSVDPDIAYSEKSIGQIESNISANGSCVALSEDSQPEPILDIPDHISPASISLDRFKLRRGIRLCGEVRDSFGSNVGGTKVSLVKRGRELSSTISDNGSFCFTLKAKRQSGSFKVFVSMDNGDVIQSAPVRGIKRELGSNRRKK